MDDAAAAHRGLPEDALPGGLTLALSGEAAVTPAKPAGNLIVDHHGEPNSGLVRFNALLAAFEHLGGVWGLSARPAGNGQVRGG
jgi:hypothetical protein